MNNQPAAAPDVTLVIPAHNAARVLSVCLDAVVPMLGTKLAEIVVVDDGSTDNTAEIACRYPVHYLHSDGRGPGAARNIGWRAARTSLVWFIDSDCVSQADALDWLLPHLTDSAVAGVGGSYGNMRPDSLLACLIHEEIIQRHIAMPHEVNFLASFNVVYRRSVLEDIGGFDEQFTNGPGRAGAEDAELAFRIREAGHRLRFDRHSIVGHYHPARLWSYLKTQARHGYFRILLYRMHPARVKGDSYSGFVDHIQPPLAMLGLAASPLLLVSSLVWIPALLIGMLALSQLPMSWRIWRRTRQISLWSFVPLGFVRAFARGLGLSRGVLAALFMSRGQAAHLELEPAYAQTVTRGEIDAASSRQMAQPLLPDQRQTLSTSPLK